MLFSRKLHRRLLSAPGAALATVMFAGLLPAVAQKPKPQPDVLVLQNGDQLTGKFVREVGGTVTFHNDVVGDVSVPWAKIKELRTGQSMAVLKKGLHAGKKTPDSAIPEGTLSMQDEAIILTEPDGTALAPIPVADAQYVVDKVTLDKELRGHPNFFQGWNGSATAGATIVQATQNQYTFNGAMALSRTVPTVSWLNPRNRTTADFNGSFGKITQAAYTANGVTTPALTIKSAIYHADAERDEYFSRRFYALAQTAFDHNYALNLDLQQIYGAGIGFTAYKTPKHELNVLATIQYEKQLFLNALPGENQNLIGSTYSATYAAHLPKGMNFSQQVEFIPAYNNPHAYSATETNSLGLPVYKSLSLTVGTLDTYLNNPPAGLPPIKRNSFQFQTGVTYNIKSKY